MFVRDCWKPRSLDEMYELIEAHPWALLVDNGAEGPFATNLPLALDRSRGEHGVLVGHLARGNPHAAHLGRGAAPTLAVFEGPFGYVTPSWYPDRDMPATYYYTAVHCYGRLRLQDPGALEASLGVLSERMERGVENGWRLDEIPRSEVTRRLPAIVGFELDIDRIEGKFKLGQDEPRRDALSVATHLATSPDPRARELSRWVSRFNIDRPEAQP